MSTKDFFGVDDIDAQELTVEITLNENVSQGDFLRTKIAGANGLAEKASNNGAGVLGIATETGSITQTISLMQRGAHVANFAHSLSASDVGKFVYLSSTSGQVTTTAPSSDNVVRVGYLQDTDGTVIISPQFIIKYS
jgi:hypothetical protein